MKKVIAMCLLAFMGLATTFSKNVTCRVGFDFTPTTDTVDLAVFFYDVGVPNYNNLDSLYRSATGEFTFDVPNGTYILRIMHPQADRVDVPVYVMDDQEAIILDVRLGSISFTKSTIDTVNLIARVANGQHVWVPMQKDEKGNWTALEDSIPDDMVAYTFKIDGRGNIQNPTKKAFLPPKVFFYMNTYDGELPVFSPSYYKNEKKEAKVKSKSYDVDTSRKLFSLLTDAWDSIYFNYPSDSIRSAKAMKLLNESLLPIKADLDPFFQQALIEPVLNIYRGYHPLNTKLYEHYRKKEYTLAEQLRATDAYGQMMQECVDLIKEVDVTSPFLTGQIYSHVQNLKYYLSEPSMYPKFGLAFGFVDQLMYDLKEKSPSYYVQAELRYSEIRSKERKQPEEAEKEYLAYKEEFARHPYVKQGRVDKQLRGLSMKTGVAAPEFELVSLDGDTVRLSQFKGKYVFIDFWGSWCSPCMGELPNVQNLATNIPADKLVVIGIVCRDKEERARKAIENQQLTYINAMADEKVQDDFGVSSYPTTLLVDKDGRIVAKNLRGAELTELVKAKMD